METERGKAPGIFSLFYKSTMFCFDCKWTNNKIDILQFIFPYFFHIFSIFHISIYGYVSYGYDTFFHIKLCYSLKGIVNPKMNILSLFTHPQVVPNLYVFICSAVHKGRYLDIIGTLGIEICLIKTLFQISLTKTSRYTSLISVRVLNCTRHFVST